MSELPYPEMSREFLGLHSINPTSIHNSAPRGAMLASHVMQTLTIEGAEAPLIESGVTQEIGNYTFNIIVPEDIIIKAIIPVTGIDMAEELCLKNIRRLLIYEGLETQTIGIMWLDNFHTLSMSHGFVYKYNSEFIYIGVGDILKGGTVLADTPSKDENGLYGLGINLNTAFMTHPGTTEDGIVVAEEILPKLSFYMEDTTTYNLSVTSKKDSGRLILPMNIYGTEDQPRTFPNIGEGINDDNIVFALREVLPETILQTSPRNMKSVDRNLDDYYQANPGGIITDIDIIRGSVLDTSDIPLFSQINAYADAKLEFNRSVLRAINASMYEARSSGMTLTYTPEVCALVKKMMMTTPASMGGALTSTRASLRIRPVVKQADIGDYGISFTVRYKKTPTYGYKLTDLNGGKGVICKILPRAQMPGGVDIIIDPNSTVGRTNLGRVYETALTSSLERMNNGVRNIMGVAHDTNIVELPKVNKTVINKAIDFIVEFYKIITPDQASYINNMSYKERKELIFDIVTRGGILHLPVNRTKSDTDVIDDLVKSKDYKPYKDHLTWYNKYGKLETSKSRVLVGKLHILLLNKICSDGIAASSVPLNHFGIPAKMPSNIKGWRLIKESPVKGVGETETRLLISYTDPHVIAEVMDRSSSPVTHVEMYNKILTSDNPCTIDKLIDRNKIPFGDTRPLALLGHQLLIRGKSLQYSKE